MEIYFKKFFVGHFFVLVMVALAVLFMGGIQLTVALLFALLMEGLFYFLNTKYLPKRRIELTDELVRIFEAEPFSEGVLKFKAGTIDLFVKIMIDFKQGLQLADTETVQFHIPADQIGRLSKKQTLNFVKDHINGIPTYIMYRTNGYRLKNAKEDIENMI